MSANQVVSFQAMVQTSSAVDTSTGAVPSWDTSDAESLSFLWSAATTTPGPQIQIAFSSESTATFSPLSINTNSTVIILTSSGYAMTITPIAFKQFRVVTTSVRTGVATITGSKLVSL